MVSRVRLKNTPPPKIRFLSNACYCAKLCTRVWNISVHSYSVLLSNLICMLEIGITGKLKFELFNWTLLLRDVIKLQRSSTSWCDVIIDVTGVFYQGVTLTRQSTARTIECGNKGRSPTWWQVVYWSNAPSLHHISWCQLEFPLRERGGYTSSRKRQRLTPTITLTICCQSWWNMLMACWETILIPAGWCTGTRGDENARVAWRTWPGLHWQ